MGEIVRIGIVGICNVLLLSFGSAAAEPSDRLANAIEGLLTHYGHLAGKVASCGLGEDAERTEELAALVADWRYPSWWDELTGARGEYEDKIAGDAIIAYRTARRAPCESGMFSDLLVTIRDEAGGAVRGCGGGGAICSMGKRLFRGACGD